MWPIHSLLLSQLPPRSCMWWEMTAPWSCTQVLCWLACGQDEIHFCHTPPKRSDSLKNNYTKSGGCNSGGSLVFLLKHYYAITQRLVNYCFCKICLWSVVVWFISYSTPLQKSFVNSKKKIKIKNWGKHWLKYQSIFLLHLFLTNNWHKYPGGVICPSNYRWGRTWSLNGLFVFFYEYTELAVKSLGNLGINSKKGGLSFCEPYKMNRKKHWKM